MRISLSPATIARLETLGESYGTDDINAIIQRAATERDVYAQVVDIIGARPQQPAGLAPASPNQPASVELDDLAGLL
ncbi:MAG: hypothetical protein AAF152_02410 [Cyanobacteria bacterium P01_A01_bin.114]